MYSNMRALLIYPTQATVYHRLPAPYHEEQVPAWGRRPLTQYDGNGKFAPYGDERRAKNRLRVEGFWPFVEPFRGSRKVLP